LEHKIISECIGRVRHFTNLDTLANDNFEKVALRKQKVETLQKELAVSSYPDGVSPLDLQSPVGIYLRRSQIHD
jgi:hypothetical protein